jgi:hypothetical protein
MNDDLLSERSVGAEGQTIVTLRTMAGVLVSRSHLDSQMREVERVDFDGSGRAVGRTTHIYTTGSTPAETTLYDAEGQRIFTKLRGRSPQFHGRYQLGKPPSMRSGEIAK